MLSKSLPEPSLHTSVTQGVPLFIPSSACAVDAPSLLLPLVLSSKIYMADLESSLHYILRVEVGKFSVLEGHRLMALKKFVAVLAKVSRAARTFLCPCISPCN